MSPWAVRHRHRQRGSVSVIFAVVAFALAGLAAMSLDGARLYMETARLRRAATTSALAAAQLLPGDMAGATALALQYLEQNGVDPAEVEVEVDDSTARQIRVQLRRSLPLTFARLLGHDSAEVGSAARAFRGVIGRTGGPNFIPLGILEQPLEFGQEHAMLVLPGSQNSPGNFGLLDYGDKGGGSEQVRVQMRDGYDPGYAMGDLIWTKTGVVREIVQEELQARIDSDPTATPATVVRSSRRLVLVPVYSGPAGGTSEQVMVKGFAACFLQAVRLVQGKVEVAAVFLRYLHDGEVLDDPLAPDYGANAVKLISD